MTNLKIAGITDEHDTCECCGRKDLKRTVALENVDTGAVVFFGTECAAQALKLDAKQVRKDARNAQRVADLREAAKRDREAQAAMADWASFLRRESGLAGADVATMIQALGGFAAARARFKAAGGA